MFFFDPVAGRGRRGAGRRALPPRRHGDEGQRAARRPGSLEVHFVVTDFKHDVPVNYTGVLPDLFREGQGVVAHGRMHGRHLRRRRSARQARREIHAARSGRVAEEQSAATDDTPATSGYLMIPELGHFALILALLLAALQAFFGIAGPQLGRDRWLAAVHAGGRRPVRDDRHGLRLPDRLVRELRFLGAVRRRELELRAAAVLSRRGAVGRARRLAAAVDLRCWRCWTVAVAIGAATLPPRFAARVLGVLGVVSFGFLLFTLATSNPFVRLIPPAADGRDLNPLLQDPALAIHPPMLYTGYVGFAVAFAFACAAMLEGKLDQAWARWTRPWTTVAWAFLSVGIALGSWWAYYELGWGGYWFWDPVENASFMPWLVGTALIHSLAVTDKRGLFKSWTLLLAILAFSLSLLGTFLVRSGVLVSVHSFAADPARGMFILAFLIIMIGGALTLYAWRAPLLKSQAGFELGSRESFLLFNNILLVIARGRGVRRHAGAADRRCARPADAVGRHAVLQSELPAADAAAAGAGRDRHPRELEARAAQRQAAARCSARLPSQRARRTRGGIRRCSRPGRAHAGRRRRSASGSSCPRCSIPIDRLRRKLSLCRAACSA